MNWLECLFCWVTRQHTWRLISKLRASISQPTWDCVHCGLVIRSGDLHPLADKPPRYITRRRLRRARADRRWAIH